MRLVAGLLVFCCATAMAQAPRILSSAPAHGAREVSVDIGAIRIAFDREMETGA